MHVHVCLHVHVCDSTARFEPRCCPAVCTPPGVPPEQSWHFNACLRDYTKDTAVCCCLITVYFLCLYLLLFPSHCRTLVLHALLFFSLPSPAWLSTILTRISYSPVPPRGRASRQWLTSIGNIIYLDLNLCDLSPPKGLQHAVQLIKALIGHGWPQMLMTVVAYISCGRI